ncbi:MAG: phosphoribosylformylglycinamidine synthase subunit PurL [Gemmatimonadales bacterium]
MGATRAETYPGDPPVTEAEVRHHGLNSREFELIRRMLRRTPTFTELGIFSALWSEHCSYKHSRPILKSLPTEGERVIQGPGENAGVLRLRDGWAVAFKIESHNHPTAVEPYQGAATGVGGILRDVFTMGAKPAALLNSLRFGPLTDSRSRYLLAGAVRGIGDYGNCVGVPTIGGEVRFSPAYAGNPLINAMCIGVLQEDQLIRASATGAGNVLITVGSRTGRDGIHGASFASEELSEKSEQRRPQVQVGDPFTEKLLLEASLELIASGHIVGIQDMGAAGLTSSSAEMAARGGMGVEIDTARVPTREPDMTPYEILLSESQERMLVVALPDRIAEVKAIAEKWELEAVAIGTVTDDGLYRIKHGDRTVAEIPGQQLIEDCPLYEPDAIEDPAAVARRSLEPDGPEPGAEQALLTLLDSPCIGGKRWVHEQYDSTVQAGTMGGPGAQAGVVSIPGTTLGIAASTDCNSRYVLLDPYEGGKAAVAEAARNVACTGAMPIGITNCLNFGNPEKPEVFYQFREACRGMAEVCTELGTPVTGGNVSFYNESPVGPVHPTPVVGMVGMLEDVTLTVGSHFKRSGDLLILIGETHGHLGGSAYWEYVLDTLGGSPPPVDLGAEHRLITVLTSLAARRLITSARDISDGGLAVAISKSCIGGPYDTETRGAKVDLRTIQKDLSTNAVLFGEDHGRAVVSVSPEHLNAVMALTAEHEVPATAIGSVGDPAGTLDISTADTTMKLSTILLRRAYMQAIPSRMELESVGSAA